MNGESSFNPDAHSEMESVELKASVELLIDRCGATEMLFALQDAPEGKALDLEAILQFQIAIEEIVYRMENEHLGRVAYCAIDAFLNLKMGKSEYAKAIFNLEEIELLLRMGLRSGAQSEKIDEVYSLCISLSDYFEGLWPNIRTQYSILLGVFFKGKRHSEIALLFYRFYN